MAAAKSALIIFRVLQASHTHLQKTFTAQSYGYNLLLPALLHALQMLISLVYCIPFGLFLSGLAAMLHWYGQPENVMRLSAEDVHDTRTGLGEATVSTTCLRMTGATPHALSLSPHQARPASNCYE